jgi:hypothetical protein
VYTEHCELWNGDSVIIDEDIEHENRLDPLQFENQQPAYDIILSQKNIIS